MFQSQQQFFKSDLVKCQMPKYCVVGILLLSSGTSFFIYVVYIPPHVSYNDFELFFELLGQCVANHSNVLILGDFNITSYSNANQSDRFCRTFTDFLDFTNLNQANTTLNSMGRMLDLVVTDIDCEVLREPLSLVPEDAHHPSLSVVCNMNGGNEVPFTTNLTATAYNFKKANFIGLYNALTYIDWSFLSKADDINSMCYLFYQKLYQIFDLYVPKYIKTKRKYPVWYNKEIIRNIKVKYKLNRSYKQTRRPERRPINRDRRRTGNYSYYLKMKQWDTEQFFKYTRMTIPVFEKLLLKIAPKIQHQYRSDGISCEERLVITLQYLSQGTSMQALAWTFHTGHSTIHYIIHETCKALWDVLALDYLETPETPEKWEDISRGFQERSKKENYV
nr:unnamed protein product [Callosobruchus analis]